MQICTHHHPNNREWNAQDGCGLTMPQLGAEPLSKVTDNLALFRPWISLGVELTSTAIPWPVSMSLAPSFSVDA